MTRNERWILSEWIVARDRTLRGHELLAHQWDTPFGEVDLFFRERRGLTTIVEVKSWNTDVFPHFEARTIITRRQLGRLERARQYVEAKTEALVKLEIAVVSHRQGREPVWRVFEPPNLHRDY